jgi:hypothetical protein
MIPAVTGKPAVVTPPVPKKPVKPPVKPAKPPVKPVTPAVRPSVPSKEVTRTISIKFDKFINDLMGKMSFRSKLAVLRNLIAYAQGITCSSDQQNRYAKALERLYNECPTKDRDALILFEQLIKSSENTTLLSEGQVTWTTGSLVPRIQKKIMAVR